jgi:hypothetical protein
MSFGELSKKQWLRHNPPPKKSVKAEGSVEAHQTPTLLFHAKIPLEIIICRLQVKQLRISRDKNF